MSKAQETVIISRRDGSKQHYHTDDECYNLPPDNRELPIKEAKKTYRPCGRCTDSEDTRTSMNDYACVECGNEVSVGCRGVRTLYPCANCDDVTTHEDIHE